MKAYELFQYFFTEERLKDIYISDIQKSPSVGIDRINVNTFERSLQKQISTIFRKVNNNTYKFSFYKLKLVSKGRGRIPREISIPTLRDKLTLNIINKMLNSVFENDINNTSIQTMINNIRMDITSESFDSFLRLDIKDYYPSIDHVLLIRMVKRKIRKKECIGLIINAVKQKTLTTPTEQLPDLEKGVPQGLSISNVLANVYLSDLDKKYIKYKNIRYYRFVDDILILLDQKQSKEVKTEIDADLKLLKLELNPDKYNSDNIKKGFTYLGYKFLDNSVSVRKSSIEKLKKSLISIVTSYKYSKKRSLKILEWRLNLRITGCRFEEKKYGWLFFFSQINDFELLYHLDWIVNKILERNSINIDKMNIKKFVKAYHQIIHNRTKTTYIPNFNDYDNSMMQEVLRDYFDVLNWESLDENQVALMFRNRIYKTVKSLEEDIQRAS